jgi:hypothetical protein
LGYYAAKMLLTGTERAAQQPKYIEIHCAIRREKVRNALAIHFRHSKVGCGSPFNHASGG